MFPRCIPFVLVLKMYFLGHFLLAIAANIVWLMFFFFWTTFFRNNFDLYFVLIVFSFDVSVTCYSM